MNCHSIKVADIRAKEKLCACGKEAFVYVVRFRDNPYPCYYCYKKRAKEERDKTMKK